MGNNKIENTKKQVKREKTAATPNKGKKQTTGTAGNYEAWQPLTPQKPVGYPEEMLEKLSSLDAKMSGLETLPKQMCDLASTLNTVSSDVELLHKEIKRLREENCFLREKYRSLEEKISSLDSNFNDLEQYGRRQNLEIHGIHMNDDESIAELESKVLTVLKKIDENISHQDIDVVHRLGK